MANDDTLSRLNQEATHALELAGMYARALEAVAQRIQGAAAGAMPVDQAALRSAAVRLDHAAREGLAALVSVIVQGARVDMLATLSAILEPSKGRM